MTDRRAFGNTTISREDSRAVWVWPWLDSVWQDVAYAMRNLRRQPGFTTVVVLVLGTVIGLHTTLATVLAGVLLRPWPGIREPARIVTLYLLGPNRQPRQGPSFSVANVRAVAERARSFDRVAAMVQDDVRVGPRDSARPTGALLVSGSFFELLGIDMAYGRGFLADEDRLGDPAAVVVLGYDFWRSALGGDPSVVGGAIRVNDVPFKVVGVASPDFGSAEPSYGKGLFIPIAALTLLRAHEPSATDLIYQPDYYSADVVARLAPGATRQQAQAELDLLSREFIAPDGSTPGGSIVTGTTFVSHPGRMNANGPAMAAALVSAGLFLVWLIACANIGNLMLARAAARSHEIGVRMALGASGRRLVRQFLTEGLVLALGASVLGAAIAYELPFVILRTMGGAAARFPFRVTLDGVVLGYAVLLAAASALAFGLAPAVHGTRTDVAAALNQRQPLLAALRLPLRGVLLGVQVALSVVLLVSASLLVRGAQRQTAAFDPGFAVDDVSVVSFELPAGAYDDPRRRALVGDLADALRTAPHGALDAFGFTTSEPTFMRRGFMAPIRLPGDAVERGRPVLYAEVSAGYLGVLRIPLVAGRDFEAADADRAVAVINETMARQHWSNENPVGKSFVMGRSAQRQIVGVMRNARTHSLDDAPPMFYQPLLQARPVPKLLFRAGAPGPARDLVAQIVKRLDPRIQIRTVPLATNLEQRLQEARTAPLLAGVLGAFALALATVGMFGVFAYTVGQRSREIGIRMALGAQPSAVVWLVLGGHSRAVIAGLVVGALGALAASVILRSRLHGVSPFDPIAYLGVAAILAAAGLAATYVPARRATRVDPVEALRVL